MEKNKKNIILSTIKSDSISDKTENNYKSLYGSLSKVKYTYPLNIDITNTADPTFKYLEKIKHIQQIMIQI